MLAFFAGQALAAADDALYTDNTATTLLRDIKSTPVNAPGALEFVNNGNFIVNAAGGVFTNTCSEVEFGTYITDNGGGNLGLSKLSLPFGLFEGDNCNSQMFFDTTSDAGHPAATPALITIADTGAGGADQATVTGLQLTVSFGGTFCTFSGNLVGSITNSNGPFNEETTPNLQLDFSGQKMKSPS